MNAPSRGFPFEGAFASRVIGQNLEILGPYSSSLAGEGGWRAAPGGLLQGRFGFGDPATGLVWNAPTGPLYDLGIVVPLQSVNYANGGVVGGPASFGGTQAQRTWQVYDRVARSWRLRQGLIANIMPTGNFWLRFAGGANYGDTVYASLTDGSAISGSVTGSVVTAFKVCSNVGPGCMAIVSSTAVFS